MKYIRIEAYNNKRLGEVMIWGWILVAFIISFLLCRRRNIQWVHYIWLLLPIENYGISVAGATIKPYMIFGFFIVVAMWMRKGGSKVSASLFSVCALILFTDVLNGLVIASVMQHILFVMCMYIFYAYSKLVDWESDAWRQIKDVCVAMLIGYGAVFIVGSFFYGAAAVTTIDRYSLGMYLGFAQIGGGYAYRLRGFTIDPNATVTALMPGFCCATFQFNKEDHTDRLRYIIAIIIYVYVAVLTDSRMAQYASIACFIAILLIRYRVSFHKSQWIIFIVCMAIAGIIAALFLNYNVIEVIYSGFMESYSQRATLTDDIGRFTIWRINMTELFQDNNWLVGVGANQIQYYTALGKPCHNTYLEWICATGVFVGITVITYIFSALQRAIKLIRSKIVGQELIPVVAAYGGICMCLLSVDHIANPSLLILLCLFHYIADGNGRSIEITENHEGGYYG